MRRAIVIFDAQSSIEINRVESTPPGVQGEGEARFEVKVKAGGFEGRNEKVWTAREEIERFPQSLRQLADSRRGSAELRSMSPDDFIFVVRLVDTSGHIVIEGQVARHYYVATKTVSRTNSIQFSIDFDPSRLPNLLAEFEEIAKTG